MKPFTVVYTHNLPLDQGVVAFHCSLEMAKDSDAAAIQCRGYLGGYSTIIVVLEGHQIPVLKGEKVIVWKNGDKYKTEELPVPNFYLRTNT